MEPIVARKTVYTIDSGSYGEKSVGTMTPEKSQFLSPERGERKYSQPHSPLDELRDELREGHVI